MVRWVVLAERPTAHVSRYLPPLPFGARRAKEEKGRERGGGGGGGIGMCISASHTLASCLYACAQHVNRPTELQTKT